MGSPEWCRLLAARALRPHPDDHDDDGDDQEQQGYAHRIIPVAAL
jgi:hypothetical protein